MDVLEAYLQAHQENPNRVRVVLEELAGVVDLADMESEDRIIVVDDEVPSAVKGKGKGKGKSGLMKRGAFPLESEEIVRQAKDRKLEEGEQKELVNVSNNQGNVDKNIPGLEAAGNQQSTNPSKDSANLEHMIQNERLLADDEENSNFNLNSNQLPGPSGKRINEEKPSLTLRKIEELVEDPEGKPKHPEKELEARVTNTEAAPVLEKEGDAQLAQLAEHVEANIVEVKHDGTGGEGKEEQGVLEKQQEVKKPQVYSPEVRVLAEGLSEVFSATPLSYLLHRCVHLVDKPATLEMFTEELLLDPRPPPH